jgi:prefoldin subunit 5
MQEFELCVLVDADGEYAVGKDADEARASYEENIQALNECSGFRLVHVTVKAALPEALQLEATAPEQQGAEVVAK